VRSLNEQPGPEIDAQPILLSEERMFEVFLIPATEHRKLFLEPEMSGVAFQAALSGLISYAVTTVTSSASGTNIARNFGHPHDVMQIMRGGLSFAVDRAIFQAAGMSPSVSFVSSQRVFDEAGRAAVDDLGYQKWAIQDDAFLALADIAATGTTIAAALDRAIAEYDRQGKHPRYLLVLVIGTNYVEPVIRDYCQRLASHWRQFEGATLVYLERVFSLNDQQNPVLLGQKWGIDFFRRRAPAIVQSELAVLAHPRLLLERCAIFDGGIRAFQPVLHAAELRTYWLQLRNRAVPDLLPKLIAAKTDLYDYAQPYKVWLSQRPWWKGYEDGEFRQVYLAGQACLDVLSHLDLRQACEDRLVSLASHYQ